MITVQPAILEKTTQAISQRLAAVQPLCHEVHLDIMDGDFVPNTTVNDPQAIADINWNNTQVSLHLMIRHPELYLRSWAFPQVSSLVVHREAVNNVAGCIALIRQLGKKVAIALNPHTPSYEITDYLDDLDFVMIMAVEPGFSAQAFNSDVLEKIRYLHELKPTLPIAVDGGVSLQTKAAIVKAGGTILCANSYLFKAEDVQTAFNLLKQ
jgi:ribulose-phosphate 3-epimerase